VKIKFVEFEQWGSKFGGWGIFGFWARTPNLTTVSYSAGHPEKNDFCLGGIGPHLGEIWGFEIGHFLAFWRTLAYFCSKLCRQIFDFLTAFDSHIRRLTIVEISGKFISWNSSNVSRKLRGGALLVHFGGLTPSGVRTLHLTNASCSSIDPEKNGFCLGGIGPHLGEIWGFEIWLFGVIWPTFAQNSVDRFSIFWRRSTATRAL